jgi:RNA:NAD 2'-phosphotransferase (TPT1/KptA family)
MRLSRFSAFVLRAYAIATAAALILDAPGWATVVGLLGIAQSILIAYRTVEFGRLMHRIVETAAKRQNLSPVRSS